MLADPRTGLLLSTVLTGAALFALAGSGDTFRIYLAASLLALGPLISGQAAMKRIKLTRMSLLWGALIGAFVLSGVLALGVAVTGLAARIAANISFGELTTEQSTAFAKHVWSIGAAFTSLSFGTIAMVAIGRWAANAVNGSMLGFAVAVALFWALLYGVVGAVALGGIGPVIDNNLYLMSGIPAIVWQTGYIVLVTVLSWLSARAVPTG